MQVELSAVLGIAGALLSFAVTTYVAILRYVISQEKKGLEDRFSAQERKTLAHGDELRAFERALHAQQLKMVEVDGEIEIVKNDHRSVSRDLEAIKTQMVTKNEFEPRMTAFERTLNTILSELRSPGRYSSTSRPAVTDPTKGR